MTVRRSLAFASADNFVNQVLALLTMAIMARLLTPTEIGLFLIVLSVIMVGDNFRDFGVTPFIVQAEDLNRQLLRTAFTVTFILSLFIYGVISLTARDIAAFYGEPSMKSLLETASLAFLLLPFTSPLTALMRREMQFANIAKINIFVGVINSCATISLGFAGFGASSYVLGYVVSKLSNIVIVIWLRPDFWIFRPCLIGARKVVLFGSASAGVVIINLLYEQIPKLAIGKILGFDAVGLFSRAMTVCQLPERSIVASFLPVIHPAMAAHARAGGNLKAIYLRGISLITAFQWPALAMLALLAEPVVGILLGPQWVEVPPLIRILALALMALVPSFLTYPLLVSVGRIGHVLLACLISLPPSVLLIFLVAPHGLQAVALSFLILAPWQMLVSLLFIRKAINLYWSELANAAAQSVFVVAGTLVLPVLIVASSPTGFSLNAWQASAAMIGAGIGWLLSVTLSGHALKAEVTRLHDYVRSYVFG